MESPQVVRGRQLVQHDRVQSYLPTRIVALGNSRVNRVHQIPFAVKQNVAIMILWGKNLW